jgi:hypothetical protein
MQNLNSTFFLGANYFKGKFPLGKKSQIVQFLAGDFLDLFRKFYKIVRTAEEVKWRVKCRLLDDLLDAKI